MPNAYTQEEGLGTPDCRLETYRTLLDLTWEYSPLAILVPD